MDIPLLTAIAEEFNAAQHSNNVRHKEYLKFDDFMNTENIVMNKLGHSRITNLLLQNYFPQNNQPEYHHFTNFDALQSIIRNRNLRLTSVSRRYNEKEFNPFYRHHNMDGYEKRISLAGVTMEQELVNDAFYLSLTHQNISSETESHLFQGFGKGNPVKIVFILSNVQTHLRKVYYSKTTDLGIALLRDFSTIVRNHNRHFVFEGLATIGFFYLPGLLAVEEEYRLLVQRPSAKLFQLVSGRADEHEYIELPLFQHPLANIRISKIVVSNKTASDQVVKLLSENESFADVRIETIS
jgi:hypothetical protein